MLNTLFSSPVVQTILSFCGIILTVILYYKGQHNTQLSWMKTTYNIISRGSSFKKLKVLYEDNPIKELSVSMFFIWNSGKAKIEKTDFYSQKPLCILQGTESRILEVSILPDSYSDQTIEIHKAENRYVINFECIDKMDGFIVEVVHTGSDIDLLIDGKIKGGGRVRQFKASPRIEWGFFILSIMCAVSLMFFSIGLIRLAFMLLENRGIIIKQYSSIISNAVGVYLIIISLAATFISIRISTVEYRYRLPKKFKKFIFMTIDGVQNRNFRLWN